MESKSTFTGFVLDPSKCSQLSLEEKRELVREIAQFSNNASEMLTSFTRGELLEIICAEMGKERKYSGYTKHRMIEHLLKLITQKPRRSGNDDACPATQARPEAKRKRGNELPPQLLNDSKHVPPGSTNEKSSKTHFCKNAACRASLSPDDAFCKRCSCCICQQFDDNKDPSLWLTCEPDSLDMKSCGMSCHLECAFGNERAGIMKISSRANLDGSFYCVSCGKINDLMRTWRKQLLAAKETRRVDVLCSRISLGHKVLSGTEKYKDIHKTVETALEMLTNEVGPLNYSCTNLARGIVNRLSCGPEVQKLCALALEAFDSMASESHNNHNRKKEPPSLDHEKEETLATAQIYSQVNSTDSSNIEQASGEHEAWRPLSKLKNERFYSVSPLSPTSLSPTTPSKSHKTQETPGSSWKKRLDESDSEYSMRIVKWLEHDGHIDKDFKGKFLSWFSVKATEQERRVVSVFIDAMIDDPACLAEQLCHTFMDAICCEQIPVSRHRFCTRLWH